MTVAEAAAAPILFRPPRRFTNGAEWLRSLGGVPLERVVFDPWPGTATEADLLRFIDRDKRLVELIDGTLVEKPMGLIEAIIAINLATELNIFVRPRNLGIVSGADSTLRMVSGRVRLPDVCFISRDRLPGGVAPREPVSTLAPDLAAEVLSEGNTAEEIAQKLREYFQSGTRLAWVIDPRARTVAVRCRWPNCSGTCREGHSSRRTLGDGPRRSVVKIPPPGCGRWPEPTPPPPCHQDSGVAGNHRGAPAESWSSTNCHQDSGVAGNHLPHEVIRSPADSCAPR